MAKLNMVQAINLGLKQEMGKDDSVVILGEDVGVDGGVFRVTDGLIEEFGEDRVMDTPLAESGIAGTAIGMALAGLITGYLGLVLIFLVLVAILAAVAIPKYQDLQKQARSKAMEGAFAAATSYSAMHLYKYLAEGGVEAEWRHVEQGVPLGDFNVDIDCTCGEQACLITIVNSPYGMDPRDYASGQSFGETYTLCD